MRGSSRGRCWSSSATSSTSPWSWLQPPRRAPGAWGTGGEVRYRLLESLRHYALERLTAEDAVAPAARRHARYFLGLVERADARYMTGDEAGALSSIEPEHDNVRAALRHLLDRGEAELAARLAGALGLFWFFRGHFDEGRAAAGGAGPGRPGRASGPSGSASGAYAKALLADFAAGHGPGRLRRGRAARARRARPVAAARGRRPDGLRPVLLGRTAQFRGQPATARPLSWRAWRSPGRPATDGSSR